MVVKVGQIFCRDEKGFFEDSVCRLICAKKGFLFCFGRVEVVRGRCIVYVGYIENSDFVDLLKRCRSCRTVSVVWRNFVALLIAYVLSTLSIVTTECLLSRILISTSSTKS